MTLNSIVSGCNQKSNRDPMLDLDENTVWSALTALRERGLVSRILPPPGSRADRFRHEVEQVWSWQTPQRAVMTELMLRGAQTPGELRSRAARFTPLESIETVMRVLDSLQHWDPPLVAPLPREAGQSAIRFDHKLYTSDEAPAPAPALAEPARLAPSRPAVAAIASSSAAAQQLDGLTGLREEIENAHAEIAELNEQLRDLKKRVDALERLMQ